MRLLIAWAVLVALYAGCGSAQHEATASTWRADLKCVEDPACKQRGSDCLASAPPDTLEIEQCGGTQLPPPSPEERADYKRKREQGIAARTWPCACRCPSAEARRLEQCAEVP